MKKAFATLFILGLTACQYNDSSIQDALRTNFNQPEGESTSVGSPSFQVLVSNISDSRCPSDVVCIWAGEVIVTFQIASNEFPLRIGQSKNFSVGERHYVLTLTDVSPYPTTKNGSEKKRAVFVLKQL